MTQLSTHMTHTLMAGSRSSSAITLSGNKTARGQQVLSAYGRTAVDAPALESRVAAELLAQPGIYSALVLLPKAVHRLSGTLPALQSPCSAADETANWIEHPRRW